MGSLGVDSEQNTFAWHPSDAGGGMIGSGLASGLNFYPTQAPKPVAATANFTDNSHFSSFPPGSVSGPLSSHPAEQHFDISDEPPLLEELGINVQHIMNRLKAVLFFQKIEHEDVADSDMFGPVAVALALGFCLLFTGKLHFGYIYGVGITGCLGTFVLLNLMAQHGSIDIMRTASVLGYSLIPVVGLALVRIVVDLRGGVGSILAPVCILWCTATASRFFEKALSMHRQRFLVAYPILLLYTCFVLITIF